MKESARKPDLWEQAYPIITETRMAKARRKASPPQPNPEVTTEPDENSTPGILVSDTIKDEILHRRRSILFSKSPEGQVWLDIYSVSLNGMRCKHGTTGGVTTLSLRAEMDADAALIAWNMKVGSLKSEAVD